MNFEDKNVCTMARKKISVATTLKGWALARATNLPAMLSIWWSL